MDPDPQKLMAAGRRTCEDDAHMRFEEGSVSGLAE
jgi:hypothetical protein